MQSDQTENLQQWIEEEGYLLNPTPTVLRELASSLTDGGENLKILVQSEILRSFDREYVHASRLARLEENEVVEFREIDGNYQTNLIVTESAVGTFLNLQDLTVAIGSEDDELVEEVEPMVISLWDSETQSYLRTPADTDVRSELTDAFSEDMYESFEACVETMEEAARVEEGANNVLFGDRRYTFASLLLAGALNEVSLRELGRATESCGISSRSTLSRIKQQLEADGYITTSPMETDVGRPPMKLQVTGLYGSDDIEMLAERVYDDLKKDSSEESEDNGPTQKSFDNE